MITKFSTLTDTDLLRSSVLPT